MRSSKTAFSTPLEGLRTALPIIFAYIPLGFAAGVAGAGAGLSPAEVALLSLLVFAGAAQFIFADMLSATPLTLITTIFLVNFRHFLYSTALMAKFKTFSLTQRTAAGAQLTDEGFAMFSAFYNPRYGSAGGVLALNAGSYFAWCGGTIAGAVAGALPQARDWGADYLLIAMFAALLMLKITAAVRKSASIFVLLAAAVMSVGLELWRPHPLNILLVATLAAALGAVCFKSARADFLPLPEDNARS